MSGQIYVRNRIGTDFEYHKEPNKTAQAHLEPGVFTFGDIGYLDEDGYLFMSDRKIDMIISGGVNTIAEELIAHCRRLQKRRDRSISSPRCRATRPASSTTGCCATNTGKEPGGRSEPAL